MVIRKFIAKSLPEALTKVKKDFGDEAVILKTRFDNNGDVRGNSKVVEVTAAIDGNYIRTNDLKRRTTSEVTVQKDNAKNRMAELNTDTGTKIKEKSGKRDKIKNHISPVINRLEADANLTTAALPALENETIKSIENKPLPSELLCDIKKELLQLRDDFNQTAKMGESSNSQSVDADKAVNDIKRELTILRKRGEESVFGQPKASILEYIRALVEKHVPEGTAVELVRKIPESVINSHNSDAGWDSLMEILSERLRPGEPIEMNEHSPTVIMLVGPPGSGKSSAAARLAFRYSREEDCPVSLISTDTFRADSKEQLASLARVIGCPFNATSTPEELAVLMNTFKQGLVIIDTSGVASRQDMDELAALIGSAIPHEIHLVVPADISAADLYDFTKNHPKIAIDKVLVTKLDQSKYRGGIIGAVARLGLKFSFESSSRELPGNFGLFNSLSFVSAVRPVIDSRKALQD